MKFAKSLLALAGCAVALAGCATDPYYDRYAYESSSYGAPGDRYAEAPASRYYDYGPSYYTPYYAPYYAPYYVAPSIGFSFGYSTGSRYWRHR